MNTPSLVLLAGCHGGQAEDGAQSGACMPHEINLLENIQIPLFEEMWGWGLAALGVN